MGRPRCAQVWVRGGGLARERYTMTSYLLWMSGVTYWYTRWRRVLRFSSRVITEPYLPVKRHAELVREARWHLAGYGLIAGISVAAHSWAAVIVWLGPMRWIKGVYH